MCSLQLHIINPLKVIRKSVLFEEKLLFQLYKIGGRGGQAFKKIDPVQSLPHFSKYLEQRGRSISIRPLIDRGMWKWQTLAKVEAGISSLFSVCDVRINFYEKFCSYGKFRIKYICYFTHRVVGS